MQFGIAVVVTLFVIPCQSVEYVPVVFTFLTRITCPLPIDIDIPINSAVEINGIHLPIPNSGFYPIPRQSFYAQGQVGRGGRIMRPVSQKAGLEDGDLWEAIAKGSIPAGWR